MFGKNSKPPADGADATVGADGEAAPRKSFLGRLFERKPKPTISDADIQKYTGIKDKDALNAWAKDRPGVAGNQAAGSITAGPTSGLGGMGAAEGYGGWGYEAGKLPKYPPQSGGQPGGQTGVKKTDELMEGEVASAK